MLQAMRDKVMGWLGWIIIGLIIITFALFGLGSYLQDKTRVFAAKVNDVEISPRDLATAYQQQRAQLEEMLGDNFKPGLIDDQAIKRRALDTLINRALLLQAAQTDGMAVSDQLLAATIHAIPAFQVDGEFSEELYQQFLIQRGATAAGFEADTRSSLAAEQLVNGLSRTVFVAPYELEQAYSLQEQQRDFSYVVVPAAAFEKDVEISEEEIAQYYSDHGDQFMIPERVRLAYVRLTAEQLGANIEIDDAELEAYYEERKQALQTLEQRRASHILIQVASDADETAVEAARTKAADLRARIGDGEDFSKLAKEFSDDPGSAPDGGDLGFFSRGAMVPEFEASVFSLDEGDVSDLVRTQFGFHIIKLTGVRESEIPPLEQVRDELLAEMQQRRAGDLFYGQLDQLTDLSYEVPDTLDEAASALGLQVQTSDWLTADGGPGIGEYPQVVAAAFSDDVLEAGHNSEPVQVGENDVIVVRVAEREAAHRAPLNEVRDQIAKILTRQKAAQAAQDRGEALLEKLQQGASMDELEEHAGIDITVEKADGIKRSATEYPAGLIKAAFSLGKPAPGSPVDHGEALPSGDYAVMRLTAVKEGDVAAMQEQSRDRFVRGYESMRSSLAVSTLLRGLRERAEIVIPAESE
ncbi:MAG: SurA N-terminal domain-containing protein [Thiogranum sp.]|nr:SurA N-terminal domain-containing protein [Thiogranum sp.]